MAVLARKSRRRKKHGFRGVLILAILVFAAVCLVNFIGKYPKEMIDLFKYNPEARGFALAYPAHKNDSSFGKITEAELSGGIPLFQQWDERWGYFHYGSSVLGITGCGPTCLSMVVAGLTGNADATPAAVADYSEKNGYYVEGVGTAWDLMTSGAAGYGLSSQEIPLSEETMTAALSAGHPLIVSLGPGDFTSSGHFIVITGYSDGKFTVNDPNSGLLSKESWSYDRLAPQIRSIWAYSVT